MRIVPQSIITLTYFEMELTRLIAANTWHLLCFVNLNMFDYFSNDVKCEELSPF